MTISPNLEPININLPKDMIYSRVLLGVDRVQTLDNINLKSELKDIATKLISNSTYSIIQSAGTSGVKSEYAKADNGTNDAFLTWISSGETGTKRTLKTNISLAKMPQH